MTVQCPECDGEFEPVHDCELLCWMCELQREVEAAAENGYLRSGYYSDEFYVDSTETGAYWGDAEVKS